MPLPTSGRNAIAYGRKTALAAVRSEIRRCGNKPEDASVDGAWGILDEISRQDRTLLCAIWYFEHSGMGTQQYLFKREWNAECRRLRDLVTTRKTTLKTEDQDLQGEVAAESHPRKYF